MDRSGWVIILQLSGFVDVGINSDALTTRP